MGLPRFLQNRSKLIWDCHVMLLLSRASLFCSTLYETQQTAIQLNPGVRVMQVLFIDMNRSKTRVENKAKISKNAFLHVALVKR